MKVEMSRERYLSLIKAANENWKEHGLGSIDPDKMILLVRQEGPVIVPIHQADGSVRAGLIVSEKDCDIWNEEVADDWLEFKDELDGLL